MIDQRLKYINVFLLILITVAIFILAALSNQFFITNLNSDSLYLFETAKFLFSHHTLAGQNEPVAPYYFPDLCLLTLLNYVTKNILIQHFMYAIIFLICYCVAVYQLMQLCFYEKIKALFGTFLALIASFFVIFPHFSFLEEWPGSHLSVIVFSLLFINFYFRTLSAPFNITTLVGFLLLVTAMFLSDKLLFPQFIVPMFCILILSTIQRKISLQKTLIWLGIFFFAILVNIITDKELHYFGISISYNANLFRIRSFQTLDHLLLHETQLFFDSLKKNIPQYSLLLFFQFSSLFLIRKNSRFESFKIVLFLWCSPFINLILVFLAGKFNTIEHLRYLDVFYFYPAILFACTLTFFLSERKYAKFAFIFAIVFIVCNSGLFLKTYYSQLQTFHLRPLYPENVRCLDNLKKQYSIHNGLAQYWYMRDIRLFSHEHLQISQIDRWLNRVNYIDNNTNFYNKSQPLFYQFMVVNALPKAKLVSEFGKPDQIVFCQDDEVWLYQKNTHLNQFNQAIIKKKIIQY